MNWNTFQCILLKSIAIDNFSVGSIMDKNKYWFWINSLHVKSATQYTIFANWFNCILHKLGQMYFSNTKTLSHQFGFDDNVARWSVFGHQSKNKKKWANHLLFKTLTNSLFTKKKKQERKQSVYCFKITLKDDWVDIRFNRLRI